MVRASIRQSEDYRFDPCSGLRSIFLRIWAWRASIYRLSTPSSHIHYKSVQNIYIYIYLSISGISWLPHRQYIYQSDQYIIVTFALHPILDSSMVKASIRLKRLRLRVRPPFGTQKHFSEDLSWTSVHLSTITIIIVFAFTTTWIDKVIHAFVLN